MAFCAGCGAPLDEENATFCTRCGAAVKSAGMKSGAASAGVPVSPTTTGISDNVAGMLCYIFIAAIIFLLVEPYNRNRFIRFHAFQSILFTVAWVVLHSVWVVPFVGLFLWPVVQIGFLICWIVLLIKAYQGQMFKLPIIGDFAEQHAG